MTKTGKDSTVGAGAPDIAAAIRQAMKETLKNGSLSVGAIADEMSRLLGIKVTEHILYSFTADSHPHRFPLEWAAAWVRATGDYALLWALTDSLGLARPTQADADLLAYGRHALARDLTESEMEVLKARILKGDRS